MKSEYGVRVSIEKRKRIVIPYRPVIKWIVRLRRSPRAIAGGLALGTFVAFTPTVGVQFAIAIFLATLLGMNRPASLVTIWITNPATIAPVYTFNYWVGKLIWPGPPVGEVYGSFVDLAAKLLSLDVWDFFDQFRTVITPDQKESSSIIGKEFKAGNLISINARKKKRGNTIFPFSFLTSKIENYTLISFTMVS